MSCQKLSKVVKSCQKLVKIAVKSWSKLSKFGKNCPFSWVYCIVGGLNGFYGNRLIVGGFNGFYGKILIVGGFNCFCGKILIVVIS